MDLVRSLVKTSSKIYCLCSLRPLLSNSSSNHSSSSRAPSVPLPLHLPRKRRLGASLKLFSHQVVQWPLNLLAALGSGASAMAGMQRLPPPPPPHSQISGDRHLPPQPQVRVVWLEVWGSKRCSTRAMCGAVRRIAQVPGAGICLGQVRGRRRRKRRMMSLAIYGVGSSRAAGRTCPQNVTVCRR